MKNSLDLLVLLKSAIIISKILFLLTFNFQNNYLINLFIYCSIVNC